MKAQIGLTLLFICIFVGSAAGENIDNESGLIIDENWQLVSGTCRACHSLKLVTSNRADGEGWLAMIRWMQEKQNLWVLEPDVEGKIIRYLAKNYGHRNATRRANLPEHMLPTD